MAKADKSVKTAVKAAIVKPGKNPTKGAPVLHAIKGGKTAPAKAPPSKPGAPKAPATPAATKPLSPLKPAPAKSAPTMPDDAPVIALNLGPAKLSPAMAAYFKKCQDKLGFVPN